MASFKMVGMDIYVGKLKALGNSTGIIKQAVYPGAGAVADAIRASLNNALSGESSGDLARSLNLSKMQNDSGYIYTKVEWVGYDSNKVPNALKANALESGTSRGQRATHFVTKAVKASKAQAEALMGAKIDELTSKIMEE